MNVVAGSVDRGSSAADDGLWLGCSVIEMATSGCEKFSILHAPTVLSTTFGNLVAFYSVAAWPDRFQLPL
jgi:hypothetical protein